MTTIFLRFPAVGSAVASAVGSAVGVFTNR